MTQLLQCNPFDASLCVSELKHRLEEEKEKLTQLMPKDDAEERAKKWKETASALHEFMKREDEDELEKVGK